MAKSDRMLVKLATEREELMRRVKRLSAKADRRKEAVIKELERRGTKGIEHTGVRITKTQNEKVVYHEDDIEAELPPKVWRAISTRVLDKDKLMAAVDKGLIDMEFLDQHSHIEYHKPYITVSGHKE